MLSVAAICDIVYVYEEEQETLLYWIYVADQLELFVYVPLDMKRTNLRFESDFKGVCLLRSALLLLLNTEYALLTFASLPTAPIKSICDSSFRKVGSE